MDASKHPDYNGKEQSTEKLLELEERIFLAAVGKGVLCSRGSWFRAQKGSDTEVFLRTTFAAATEEGIRNGIERLGEALRGEFGVVGEGGNGCGGDREVNGH